jgi:hypothetical protein
MAGAAEDDVQPFLTAPLVDRAEIHDHPAIPPRRVTDTQQDDVPLIALHILQVLHEQAVELAVVLAKGFLLQQVGERGIVRGELVQRGFNFGLLGLGEGDDADTQPDAARQEFTDQFGDVVRFRGIDPVLLETVGETVGADR